LRIVFYSFSAIALAASDGNNPVLTGTVNIVLANANGIVVITDSNQTRRDPRWGKFTDPHPGQKLFRIDDKTVCTIAGFGSTSLPRFSEITSSAAGVLDTYAEQLRGNGATHSFHEKLTSLEFLFDLLLTGVSNLQHPDPAEVADYGFELILAGYDSDGAVKIGKFVLSTHLSNGFFSPVIEELREETVGRELAHETAGVGGRAVENILAYPGKLTDEPDIAKYATSRVTDRGSSLTVAEMEALAKSLVRLSALFNSQYYPVAPIGFRAFWPIGGKNQIATLEKGSLPKLDHPTFREAETKPRFSILSGMTLDAHGLAGASLFGPSPGSILLSVRNKYLGG
jgi:hypothetical protein